MGRVFLPVSALLLVLLPDASDASEALRNAELMCRAAEQSATPVPCEVSETEMAVTVLFNTDDYGAQVMCEEMVKSLALEGMHFNDGLWRLRIKSPIGAQETLAFCALPKSSN